MLFRNFAQFGNTFIMKSLIFWLLILDLSVELEIPCRWSKESNEFALEKVTSAFFDIKLFACDGVKFNENSFESSINLKSLVITSNRSFEYWNSAIFTTNLVFNPLANTLTHLEVSNLNLSINSLPEDIFCRLFQLKSLKLTHNNFEDFRYLNCRGNLSFSKLKFLNLSSNYIRNLQLPIGLSSLSTLDLSKNELDNANELKLERVLGLKFLSLNYNNLKVDEKTFSSSTLLRILQLKSNKVGNIPSKAFSHLQNLEKLDLSDNQIEYLPNGLFPSSLMRLTLKYNNIHLTSETFKFQTLLKYLDLEFNNIHNLHLEMFKQNPFLKKLNLNYNNLSVTNVTFFSQLVPFLALTHLKLNGNQIGDDKKDFFTNWTHLASLSIADTGIKNIDNQQLRNHCPNLEELDISANGINEIDYNELPRSLKTLNLRKNNLSEVKSSLRDIYLTLLDISYNKITKIDNETLPITLKSLNIGYNLLTTFDARIFINPNSVLDYINLENNKIQTLPSYRTEDDGERINYRLNLNGNTLLCSCENFWLASLKIYTKNSLIDHFDRCLKFPLRQKPILVPLPSEAYQYLCQYPQDQIARDCARGNDHQECNAIYNYGCELMILDCGHQNRTRIPQLSDVNYNYVVQMFLDNNNFSNFSVDTNILEIITVERLYLNKSGITEINSGWIAKMFDTIVELHLENNDIEEIKVSAFFVKNVVQLPGDNPRHFRQKLPKIPTVHPVLYYKDLNPLRHLQELYLQNSSIQFIDYDIFKQLLPKLKTLNLQSNKLKNPDILKIIHNDSSLEEIYLADNNFICDCKYWKIFHHPLISSTVKDINHIRCAINNQKTLLFSKFDDLHCGLTNTISSTTTSNTFVIFITVSLFIILAIIISTASCIHFSLYLRVWIYHKIGFRFNRGKNEDDKIFDAFVSYCAQDAEFVVNHLEKGLNNYRLCLHDRHFPPGALIVDSIILAVEKSCRTIVVLSNNFIKSNYCNFEFNMAHEQQLRDKKCRLIVIVLEDIDEECLSVEMKYYINTFTYLKWGQKNFWPNLIYAMPNKSKHQNGETDRLALFHGLSKK